MMRTAFNKILRVPTQTKPEKEPLDKKGIIIETNAMEQTQFLKH